MTAPDGVAVQMPDWYRPPRPPFEPGNEMAAKHGAYSPRKVDPLAGAFVDAVLADGGARHAHAQVYRPALWAWARAEAQVQLLTEYLAVAGEAAGEGVGDLESERVRAAYLLLHRAEARALSGRARLGLDPLSRARLGKDVAAGQLDTARLMAELERRDRAPQDVAAEVVDELSSGSEP